MKVMTTFFSQTGNTEKIAKALHEVALTANEAELKKLEDISAADLAGYDFIFIGSPVHAGGLAAPVKEFLNNIQSGSGKKMAGFITHAAPAYPEQELEKIFEPIKEACQRNNIEFVGCFDCQGFLSEALHEAVKKHHNATDEEWAERVKAMTGHPDAKDVETAKLFAKKVLG